MSTGNAPRVGCTLLPFSGHCERDVVWNVRIGRSLRLVRIHPIKQPKCPSTDEWIKKMWHISTMEYYSAIKRNEIEFFVVRWMDLESVIQSEVS